MSNQCPNVEMTQQQQSEINRSVSSPAPTSVNHRSAPTQVNLVSKTAFVTVVKKTVQYHQITKNDVFKGFMSIMYASHVCFGSADIFENVLDHLLQKKK